MRTGCSSATPSNEPPTSQRWRCAHGRTWIHSDAEQRPYGRYQQGAALRNASQVCGSCYQALRRKDPSIKEVRDGVANERHACKFLRGCRGALSFPSASVRLTGCARPCVQCVACGLGLKGCKGKRRVLRCKRENVLQAIAAKNAWGAVPAVAWVCTTCCSRFRNRASEAARLEATQAAAKAEAAQAEAAARDAAARAAQEHRAAAEAAGIVIVEPAALAAPVASPVRLPAEPRTRPVVYAPPKRRNRCAKKPAAVIAQELAATCLTEMADERARALACNDGVERGARNKFVRETTPKRVVSGFVGLMSGNTLATTNNGIEFSGSAERRMGTTEYYKMAKTLAASVHELANKMCIAKWNKYISAVGEDNATLYVDGSWDSRIQGRRCTVNIMVLMPASDDSREPRHDLLCSAHITKLTTATATRLTAEMETVYDGDCVGESDSETDEATTAKLPTFHDRFPELHDLDHRRALVVSSSANLEAIGLRVAIKWLQKFCGLKKVKCLVHDKCKKAYNVVSSMFPGDTIEDNYDLGHRVTSWKKGLGTKLGHSKHVAKLNRSVGNWIKNSVQLAKGDVDRLRGYTECGRLHWRNDHSLCEAFGLHNIVPEHFKWGKVKEVKLKLIDDVCAQVQDEAEYIVGGRDTCSVEASNSRRWAQFLPKSKGFGKLYPLLGDMAALQWQNPSWRLAILDMVGYFDGAHESAKQEQVDHAERVAKAFAGNELKRNFQARALLYRARRCESVFATQCNIGVLRKAAKDAGEVGPDLQAHGWTAKFQAQTAVQTLVASQREVFDAENTTVGICDHAPSQVVTPGSVGRKIREEREARLGKLAPAAVPSSGVAVQPAAVGDGSCGAGDCSATAASAGSGGGQRRPTEPAAASKKRQRPAGTTAPCTPQAPRGDTGSDGCGRARKKRRPYLCKICKQPKKGHTCTGPPQPTAAQASGTRTVGGPCGDAIVLSVPPPLAATVALACTTPSAVDAVTVS